MKKGPPRHGSGPSSFRTGGRLCSAPQKLQHQAVEAGRVFHMQPVPGVGNGLDVRLGEVTPDDIMMLRLDVGRVSAPDEQGRTVPRLALEDIRPGLDDGEARDDVRHADVPPGRVAGRDVLGDQLANGRVFCQVMKELADFGMAVQGRERRVVQLLRQIMLTVDHDVRGNVRYQKFPEALRCRQRSGHGRLAAHGVPHDVGVFNAQGIHAFQHVLGHFRVGNGRMGAVAMASEIKRNRVEIGTQGSLENAEVAGPPKNPMKHDNCRCIVHTRLIANKGSKLHDCNSLTD